MNAFTSSIRLDVYKRQAFSQFTYGAGVKIPLDVIFNMKTPLSMSIDYVNLELKNRERNYMMGIEEQELKNYNTFSINMNWVPGW